MELHLPGLEGDELWASEEPAIELRVTPLLIAADSNNLELARVLLNKGAELGSR
jgi:hypothetical protein